jgi:hypothetical protein
VTVVVMELAVDDDLELCGAMPATDGSKREALGMTSEQSARRHLGVPNLAPSELVPAIGLDQRDVRTTANLDR